MGLEAGAIDANGNFINNDCMAKFMEDAMPPPATKEDPGRKGRREFLIAIASGVINYLKAHDDDSFVVTVALPNETRQGSLEIL